MVRSTQVGTLKVQVYPDRTAAGLAAAGSVADTVSKLQREQDTISVVFATGASQFAILEALTGMTGLPWNRIVGFHLDEYVEIPAGHPASFRRYLRERLTSLVPLRRFFEIDGDAKDPEAVCREYARQLRLANPGICLLGIGENGHLAFNDPGEADFEDPEDVKIVALDAHCREQQAAEGWFKSAAEVPERAITLTIPAILRLPKLVVSVPGSRKADIVRRTLEEAVSTDCPATILRTHPDSTLYLDEDSAAEWEGLG